MAGAVRWTLAAAVAAALAANADAVFADAVVRSGATTLREQLRGLMPATAKAPRAPAAVLTVGSCADDGGAATLRSVVAAAGEGDTVDLSTLACSAITLSQGAVAVLLDDLTIVGPGATALAIDGAGTARVFVHPGSGALTLRALTLRHGAAVVTGNHVTGGGCIASAGSVVLDHATVRDCLASGEGVYGGGIFATTVALYTSTLAANIGHGFDPYAGTATFGGGAYADVATVVASTISGNRAEHDGSGGKSGYDIGGGLFTNRGGLVSASTIDGNYASGIGGGIATFSGTLDVIDSTVSGNVAKSGSGGGIDLRVFADNSVRNSTIAGNRAAAGGGIYLRGQPQSVTVQSTIIAGNSAAGGGADIGAAGPAQLTGANNLVVAAGPALLLPGDTLHADPLLQPLADNGGRTRTRALSAGSPALDRGNNVAALADDQRGSGFPRVRGAAPDIGAFEGVVAPPPLAAPLSPGALAWLAALLLAAGAWACNKRVRRAGPASFTPLSPLREHSSQT